MLTVKQQKRYTMYMYMELLYVAYQPGKAIRKTDRNPHLHHHTPHNTTWRRIPGAQP